MAVTYSLTDIQEEAFVQRFSLYRPKRGVVVGRPEIKGVELVAENIPGRIGARSESSDTVPGFNRASVDQMDTTDLLRLPEVYLDGEPLQIGDGWVARLTSGGGGENGAWMQIQGEGRNLIFRAGTRTYLAVRGTKPPIYVEPPTP